jgi:hypothetical protein
MYTFAKKLIFSASLFLSFCFLNNSYAQSNLPLACGDVHLKIPDFQPTNWYLFNNQYAVKAKILRPINEDTARIEIRINHYAAGEPGFALVIKSENNKFIAVRYLWIDQTTIDDFTNMQNEEHMKFKFLSRDTLKLTGNITWTSFFQTLINNHFFDSQNGDLLTLEVGKKSPETTIIHGANGEAWEIKIGKSFRFFDLRGYYPEPDNVEGFNNIRIIKTWLGYLQ